MPVSVQPWPDEDEGAWNALCERHGDLFQTGWVSRAAEVFGAKTLRFRIDGPDGSAGVALLEVGSRRVPAVDRLFSRRFHVQGGPLPLDDRPMDADVLARALDQLAAERGAVESDWKPTWPTTAASDGWETTRFGLAWRDLPETPDEVLPTLSRAHRKAVRKAAKVGITVREEADAAVVFDLVDRSFARSELAPPNRPFLDRLHAGADSAGRAIRLVAEDTDGLVAALFAVRCGDTVFNLFHGRRDGETHGAANLLHLRLFEGAVAAGARRIHTGDAALGEGDDGVAGITRFKRHMGFRVEPCERLAKVHRPLAQRVGRGVLSAYRLLRGEVS
jgi:GNAT acetyltransferase-like protein